LRDLLNPKITPRIPSKVRERARYILKHFPAESEMERVANELPEFFGPLYIAKHR